jgi:hypothetical protein
MADFDWAWPTAIDRDTPLRARARFLADTRNVVLVAARR